MTIFQILSAGLVGIPVVYSHFKNDAEDLEPVTPPYVAYIGAGQDNFEADNTNYHNNNRYQIEYYFTKKDESLEAKIEKLLLDNGLLYEKSDDVWIDDEGVFVIYYNV